MTNDVDNVQTALQQTFSSLLENIMRVLGILIMMFVLSWQLALVALIALPLSAAAAGIVGSRAQKHFGKQWAATGALNGQIEEDFTGHQLVTDMKDPLLLGAQGVLLLLLLVGVPLQLRSIAKQQPALNPSAA